MDLSNVKIIARILFGLPFVVFGMMYFTHSATMVTVIPAFLPVPLLFVYLIGILLILSGLGIVLDYNTVLAYKFLTVLLIIYVLTVDLPAVIAMATPVIIYGLLKDIALIGASLAFIALLDH